MSGFEIVGVALGVLPLVVAAVENYKKAFAPFVKYKDFEARLQSLEGRIVTQKAMYLEAARRLLQSALGRDKALSMLGDPKHVAWNDVTLEKELESYMEDTFTAFKFVATEVERILRSICEGIQELAEAAKRDVKIASPTGKSSRKRIAKKLAFSFSGSSQLEMAMTELSDRNREFRTLVKGRRDEEDQSLMLNSKRKHTRPKDVKSFRLVQQASKLLYETLQEACNKHELHKAHLNLVPRVENQTGTRIWFDVSFRRPVFGQVATTEKSFRLRIESSIGQCGTYQTTKATVTTENVHSSGLKRIASTTSLPLSRVFRVPGASSMPAAEPASGVLLFQKLKRLKKSAKADESSDHQPQWEPTTIEVSAPSFLKDNDLCSYIVAQTRNLGESPSICIGCVENSPQHKLSFHLAAPPKPEKPHSAISLRSVLEAIKTRRQAGRLSEHERYRFARLLATAALQFHNTPWLKQDSWRSEDVYLCDYADDNDGTTAMLPPLTEPYVDVSVRGLHQPPSRTSTTDAAAPRPWIPNPLLFGLALLLIELALEKPLNHLQIPADFVNGAISLDAEYATARRLLREVGGATNPAYQSVVAQCLGNFCSQEDLASDALQEQYHESVVCALFELERHFADLSLVECDCRGSHVH